MVHILPRQPNKYVHCSKSISTTWSVLFRVPQSSDLGPILFLLYTADLVQLVESFGLQPHLYADDIQIYGSCRPCATDHLQCRVTQCIAAVADWMKSNWLQLNTGLTEFLRCTSACHQHQLATDQTAVPAFASQLRASSWHLHQCWLGNVDTFWQEQEDVSPSLQQIQRSVTQPVLELFVVSLVLTYLNYGRVRLDGLLTQLPIWSSVPVDMSMSSAVYTGCRCLRQSRIG